MIKRLLSPLGVLLGAFSAPASALNITAEFIPRVTGANTTKFVNTTPLSGYCYGNSSNCRPGDFTISFPLNIQRVWRIPAPIEAHNYQKVDGNWQTINVTNDVDGQSVDLHFRLNLLSRRYNRRDLHPGGIEGSITRISNLSGISGAATGGCQGRVGAGNAEQYEFAWSVPMGFTTCTRPPQDGAMGPYSGFISDVSVGYELQAPNPFLLGNGTYRGTHTYTVGQNGQIDLGEGIYYPDLVTFHFELKVQHELRVDFPADSDRAILEPDGGWGQWLHRGKAPTTLRRVHPFQIWASAPMKMYLKCAEPLGQQCSMREPGSGHQVPLVIGVTLPGSIRHNGAPVHNVALPVGEAQALSFQSIAVSAAAPARLHYAVDPAHIPAMLANSGRQYSGDVTIVFDAQI